jgi:hypothetical protein
MLARLVLRVTTAALAVTAAATIASAAPTALDIKKAECTREAKAGTSAFIS